MIAKNEVPACPLCRRSFGAKLLFERGRRYYYCPQCGGVFVDPKDRLGTEDEKARYLLHRNDVYDKGYRNFVSPLVEAITEYQKRGDRGLDFGAGPGPVVSKMLEERGYRTRLYDPFFYNEEKALEERYDYIVCSEVMEHFYDPAVEFLRLRAMLSPGGRLYCTTETYSEDLDFPRWHYKEDATHVFFYAEKTLRWIAEKFGFGRMEGKGRLLVFEG